MQVAEFKPTDSTGYQDNDMLFRSYITGPQGARYELFRESQHTEEDIKRAKKYLRSNFDVVSIHIVNETN